MTMKLLVFTVILPTVLGHSTYVPHEACVNMFPRGHNIDAQSTRPPFVISVNTTTYTRNSVIEVFVNATGLHDIDFYEGILLQARHAVECGHRDVNKQVGTFMLQTGEDVLNLMACTNQADTIAHKVHAHVYNRTFFWRVPSDLTGPVVLRCKSKKDVEQVVSAVSLISSSGGYIDGIHAANDGLLIDRTSSIYLATIARRQETFWTNVLSDFIIDPTNRMMEPTVCTDGAVRPWISLVSLFMLITIIKVI